MHTQSLSALLPDEELECSRQFKHTSDVGPPSVLEYLPLAQSVQPADPSESLYVPAAHATHVSPSCPVYPALHRQSSTIVLPVDECEPAGQ